MAECDSVMHQAVESKTLGFEYGDIAPSFFGGV
jgi:hypothetical protein